MSKLLKSKFLFGLMMVLAFAVVATSVDAAITTTLKQGSKGAEVSELQTLLKVSPATGYFGPKTKAAVMAFQTSKGLKADGVVGAMTRGALTETTPVVTPTPTPSTLPAGCTSTTGYSSTTGAKCDGTTTTPATTGNTDGSITASTSSYVSSGITVKKGETKDVAAVRLQATVGPVKVNRVDVKFNVRPWLFFSKVELHDNTGKVLATKNLSSIADTTEITVGSSYMVRFDGIEYTVTPGTNPDLAVSASVLAATDKINGTQSVTTTFSSMRTTSEIGYVDSVDVSSYSNTVTLSSTASAADVYSRVSPNSPLTGQQVVNANNVTENVTLGVFSLKSTNNASTLNTFAVTIGGTSTPSTDFSNYRLYVNGSSVAGGTLSGTTVTFSNLTVPLDLDKWTDLTVKTDVKAAASGTVYLSLVPSTTSIVVTDTNYATPTIESGTRTANTLTLTQNSVTVSGISATLGSAIVQSNVTTGYNAKYAFTLTNSSNNDLYVSATPGTFVSTTLVGSSGTTTGTALTSLTVSNPSTVAGDDASGTYYAIPAGTARTFEFAAVLKGTGTTVFKATAITYGTTTSGTGASISSGLSNLSLTASF